MDSLPYVSIGIPIYNEEDYISETLLSAVNQSYKNIKIFISDNCSTDKSFDIIQSIASLHKNIFVKRHEKNLGATHNFIYVLQKADTEYFCWLGGHDIMESNFIEKAVNEFQNNAKLSLVYPRSEMIDKEGKSLNTYPDSEIDTTTLDDLHGPLKVVNSLNYCTAIHGLFRTKILKEYKIKPIVGSDHIILYHAAVRGKLLELKEILYRRREIRHESDEEAIKRYNQFGLKNKSIENPYKEMCKEHLLYTIFSNKIAIKKKILLLINLSAVLKLRFNSPYLVRLYDIYINVIRRKGKFLSPFKKVF